MLTYIHTYIHLHTQTHTHIYSCTHIHASLNKDYDVSFLFTLGLLTFHFKQNFLSKIWILYASESENIARNCAGLSNHMIFRRYHLRVIFSPPPTITFEDHAFSAFRECLFNIFAAVLHIWRTNPPSATLRRTTP